MPRNPKTIIILLLSVSLLGGAVLANGCPGTKQPDQIIKDITPQEAFSLIQEKQDTPDFVIIDVRTPEEFAKGHIEGAINIDFYSQTFRDELNIIDKNKTYLIYCRSGVRSGSARDIMEEINFKEVYNMTGGITQWEAEGLPTVQESAPQSNTDTTPQAAFLLMRNNPDVVILDIDNPTDFAEEHIEDAINIYYYSDTFVDELKQLDRNNTYLVYCRCPGRGISGETADMMTELNFKEVYNITGGLASWKAEGLPTIKGTEAEVKTAQESAYIDTITPAKAYAMMQSNPGCVIIDARTPEAFASEHIEGAINIDYQSENFRDELKQLDKSNITFAYYEPYGNIPQCCGTNLKATIDIFQTFKELNFKEAYLIEGGIIGWKVKGLPTIT